MNQRIDDLMYQAGLTAQGCLNKMDDYDREAILKFAELIVGECVEQLELVRKYRYDRVQPLENQQTIIDECQYQIKQHFGVKE